MDIRHGYASTIEATKRVPSTRECKPHNKQNQNAPLRFDILTTDRTLSF